VNTYRAVPLASGRWAIAWSTKGQNQGLLFGTFETEVEALFRVYEFARIELLEAGGSG
jgi:hypothetical protein